MNVNGISSSSYASMSAAADAVEKTKEAEAAAVKEDVAAVYEKGTKVTDMSEEDRASLVKQLEADLQAHKERLIDLVKQMLGKQSKTYAQSVSGDDENAIWRFLAKGDYTVDAETQAAAREAISDDGYWGVEQTSDRIVKYALALSGGDPEQLDAMIEATKKGFGAAEKAWGGEMPSITGRTYDAVMEKFDKIKKEMAGESAEAVTA